MAKAKKAKAAGIKNPKLPGSFRVHGNKIVIVFKNKSIATPFYNTISGWVSANQWWANQLTQDELGRYEYTPQVSARQTLDEHITFYVDYITNIQKLQPHTICSYKNTVLRMQKYFLENNKDFTPANIDEYFTQYLTTTTHKNRSKAAYLTILAKFFKVLVENNRFDYEPNLKKYNLRLTADSSPLHIYSPEEYKNLLDYFSYSPETVIIFQLLWHTGCRVSEILKLERKDIDFSSREIFLSNKIYKNTRESVMITDKVRDILVKALKLHPTEQKVFKTKYKTLYVQLTKALEKLGIHGVRQPFHSFRKTYATRLLSSGLSVTDTAEALRHRNINTTIKIYKSFNKSELLDKLNAL